MVRAAALGLLAAVACFAPAFAAERASLPLCPNVEKAGVGAWEPERSTFPKLDQSITVEVGQPMLFKGLMGSYGRSVTLPKGASYDGSNRRSSTDKAVVPAGSYVADSVYGNHIQMPVEGATIINGKTGEPYAKPRVWLALLRNNGRLYLFWDRGQGLANPWSAEVPAGQFTVDYCQTPMSGGFSSQIDYAGQSGGVVNLSYREFINGISRPAFTQELKYDLKEGSEFAFRGARFEIIKATNTDITYRVIRPLE